MKRVCKRIVDAAGAAIGLTIATPLLIVVFVAVRLSYHFRSVTKDETPILNKTGLTGTYDFALPWTPETIPGVETGPSIFTALRELGLRLEKGKFQIETIIVDGAERPVLD